MAPRDRHLAERGRRALSRSVWLAVVAVLAGIGLLIAYGGTGAPTASLASPTAVVGRATPLEIRLGSGRAGLRSWQIVLATSNGDHVLDAGELPRTSFLGGDERQRDLRVTIDAAATGLPEGPAHLVIDVADHSVVGRFRGLHRALEVPITIDLTPPTVAVDANPRVVSVGGSELVTYTVDPDATESGVRVGDSTFPGTRTTGDPRARSAVFAIPWDAQPNAALRVYAVDAAGNRREVPLSATIKTRRWPTADIAISADFVARKLPPIAAATGTTLPADPIESYLFVNRELRRRSEDRLREIVAESQGESLIGGAFRQQPNSKVVSRYAEQRTYRWGDREIDRQTHLGYDLASLRQSPILAAAAGRVLFVGDLGIYGNVVVLDHGLGITSLYAHLSSIDVKPGQTVPQGEVLGKSGETGLAGGDHLHFSIQVRGQHVDPVEWWDPHWVKIHFHEPLGHASPAAAAAPVAPAAAGAEAPSHPSPPSPKPRRGAPAQPPAAAPRARS